jgi:hypothetical protein
LSSLRSHALISCAIAVGLLGATPAPVPPIGVSVQTQRTSFDLLDTLAIEVIAHNPSPAIRQIEFAQPSEYEIDIARDGRVIWTSLPPSPPPNVTFAPHQRPLVTGSTPLIIYDWNELTHDGWSPLPGTYTVRVKLLDASKATASIDVKFMQPLPTSVLDKLKPGEAVTIAGTLDATREILTDANGSIRLSRRLSLAPAGVPIVVRGFPTEHPDGSRTLTFQRWASYGGPLPAPAPPAVRLPVPAPKPTTSAR